MSIALVTKLIGSLHRWRLRQVERKALMALDDRLLRDIGIERCDIGRVVEAQMGYLFPSQTPPEGERRSVPEDPYRWWKVPGNWVRHPS